MRKTPSVSLSDHNEGFISGLIETGRYKTTSEVIREGLRLLEEREQERGIVQEELRSAIRAGLESGEPTPMESADNLIATFKARPRAFAS
ncbi:MAG: type II toxin-antitoxin system ParD family antitoxin [Proteobacteria bacterium]|jgi:antitoxin ParD1/3/4|nr:type II toxin-antitoxin system ParD family antitoxin [Pseudomonadota bacterium]